MSKLTLQDDSKYIHLDSYDLKKIYQLAHDSPLLDKIFGHHDSQSFIEPELKLIDENSIEAENIKFSDVIKFSNDENKIFITGQLGTGKTTFLNQILCLWKKDQLDNRFDYVFKLNLKDVINSRWNQNFRDEKYLSDKLASFITFSLIQITSREMKNKFTFELIAQTLTNFPEKILFLVDGDELNSNSLNNSDIIKILNDLSQFPNIILTTRPYLIDQTLSSLFNQQIEIAGFSHEGLNRYINKFFEQQKNPLISIMNDFALKDNNPEKTTDNLLKSLKKDYGKQKLLTKLHIFIKELKLIQDNSHLDSSFSLKQLEIEIEDFYTNSYKNLLNLIKSNPQVNDLLTRPMNLEMVCQLYSDPRTKIEQTENINIIKIYRDFISLIIQKYYDRINPEGNNLEGKNLALEQNVELKIFKELAYQLSFKSTTISENLIQDIINAQRPAGNRIFLENIVQFGLLKVSGLTSSETNIQKDDSYSQLLQKDQESDSFEYNFIHPSFQEFLTALTLKEKLESSDQRTYQEAANFIAYNRHNLKFLNIWKFVTKLISKDQYASQQLVDRFWHAIQSDLEGVLVIGKTSTITLLATLIAKSFKKLNQNVNSPDSEDNQAIIKKILLTKNTEISLDQRIPNLDKIIKFIDGEIINNFSQWGSLVVETHYLSDAVQNFIWDNLETIANNHKKNTKIFNLHESFDEYNFNLLSSFEPASLTPTKTKSSFTVRKFFNEENFFEKSLSEKLKENESLEKINNIIEISGQLLGVINESRLLTLLLNILQSKPNFLIAKSSLNVISAIFNFKKMAIDTILLETLLPKIFYYIDADATITSAKNLLSTIAKLAKSSSQNSKLFIKAVIKIIPSEQENYETETYLSNELKSFILSSNIEYNLANHLVKHTLDNILNYLSLDAKINTPLKKYSKFEEDLEFNSNFNSNGKILLKLLVDIVNHNSETINAHGKKILDNILTRFTPENKKRISTDNPVFFNKLSKLLSELISSTNQQSKEYIINFSLEKLSKNDENQSHFFTIVKAVIASSEIIDTAFVTRLLECILKNYKSLNDENKIINLGIIYEVLIRNSQVDEALKNDLFSLVINQSGSLENSKDFFDAIGIIALTTTNEIHLKEAINKITIKIEVNNLEILAKATSFLALNPMLNLENKNKLLELLYPSIELNFFKTAETILYLFNDEDLRKSNKEKFDEFIDKIINYIQNLSLKDEQKIYIKKLLFKISEISSAKNSDIHNDDIERIDILLLDKLITIIDVAKSEIQNPQKQILLNKILWSIANVNLKTISHAQQFVILNEYLVSLKEQDSQYNHALKANDYTNIFEQIIAADNDNIIMIYKSLFEIISSKNEYLVLTIIKKITQNNPITDEFAQIVFDTIFGIIEEPGTQNIALFGIIEESRTQNIALKILINLTNKNHLIVKHDIFNKLIKLLEKHTENSILTAQLIDNISAKILNDPNIKNKTLDELKLLFSLYPGDSQLKKLLTTILNDQDLSYLIEALKDANITKIVTEIILNRADNNKLISNDSQFADKINNLLGILNKTYDNFDQNIQKLHDKTKKLLRQAILRMDNEENDLKWINYNFENLLALSRSEAVFLMELIFDRVFLDNKISKDESDFITKCIEQLNFSISISFPNQYNFDDGISNPEKTAEIFILQFKNKSFALNREENEIAITEIVNSVRKKLQTHSENILPNFLSLKYNNDDSSQVTKKISSIVDTNNQISANDFFINLFIESDHLKSFIKNTIILLEFCNLETPYIAVKLFISDDDSKIEYEYFKRNYLGELDEDFRREIFGEMIYTETSKPRYYVKTIKSTNEIGMRIINSVESSDNLVNSINNWSLSDLFKNSRHYSVKPKLFENLSTKKLLDAQEKFTILYNLLKEHLNIREYGISNIAANNLIDSIELSDKELLLKVDRTESNNFVIKNLIQKEKKSDKALAEINLIENDIYKNAFYSKLMQILNAVYIAASCVSTELVANQKKGVLGNVGDVIQALSVNAPVFGLAANLVGQIFSGIDANIQQEKIENFANFATRPSKMEEYAEKIARKLALSNKLEISEHSSILLSALEVGKNLLKSNPGEAIANIGIAAIHLINNNDKNSIEQIVKGEKAAEIVAKVIITKIFNGEYNKPQNILSLRTQKKQKIATIVNDIEEEFSKKNDSGDVTETLTTDQIKINIDNSDIAINQGSCCSSWIHYICKVETSFTNQDLQRICEIQDSSDRQKALVSFFQPNKVNYLARSETGIALLNEIGKYLTSQTQFEQIFLLGEDQEVSKEILELYQEKGAREVYEIFFAKDIKIEISEFEQRLTESSLSFDANTKLTFYNIINYASSFLENSSLAKASKNFIKQFNQLNEQLNQALNTGLEGNQITIILSLIEILALDGAKIFNPYISFYRPYYNPGDFDGGDGNGGANLGQIFENPNSAKAEQNPENNSHIIFPESHYLSIFNQNSSLINSEILLELKKIYIKQENNTDLVGEQNSNDFTIEFVSL